MQENVCGKDWKGLRGGVRGATEGGRPAQEGEGGVEIRKQAATKRRRKNGKEANGMTKREKENVKKTCLTHKSASFLFLPNLFTLSGAAQGVADERPLFCK